MDHSSKYYILLSKLSELRIYSLTKIRNATVNNIPDDELVHLLSFLQPEARNTMILNLYKWKAFNGRGTFVQPKDC